MNIKYSFFKYISILLLSTFLSYETCNAEIASKTYTPLQSSINRVASNPQIIQQQLESSMRKLLNNPASLTIKLEATSKIERARGYFKKVFVHTSGGNIENLRLEKADIFFEDVQLNLEKLFDKNQIDPVSMKNINMDIIITEKDLNRFIKTKSKSIKVRNPKVKMKKGKIELSGSAKYRFVKVKFWALGQFKIKRSKEIWFYARRMKINYLSMPRSFVGMIVKRINPILKLDKFPFKLNLSEIRIEPGKMIFTSFRKGKNN